jgi:hypothetical protein
MHNIGKNSEKFFNLNQKIKFYFCPTKYFSEILYNTLVPAKSYLTNYKCCWIAKILALELSIFMPILKLERIVHILRLRIGL